MSEQEHKAAIMMAREALNEAIRNAEKDGYAVEVILVEGQQMERGKSMVVIDTTLWREI